MSVRATHPAKARRPEWLALRAQVLSRAGHHCEGCGALNYSVYEADRIVLRFRRAPTAAGAGYQVTRDQAPLSIVRRRVLTIAHLCSCDPPCVNAAHVMALCQKCHLQIDAAQHAAAAKETRRRRKDDQRPLLAAMEKGSGGDGC